jgi:type 1 fimbria pilin
MKSAMKTLLALALVLSAATAWAQAAGNWQRIHGQVQAVQGNQLTIKADDGRVLTVDMSQVSQSVQRALAPNEGVTIAFQDLKAGVQNNRSGAQLFVTQAYQGFLERAPTMQERTDWTGFLIQCGDVRGMTEMIVKSPEYIQKNKNDQQAIRDLYEGLFGRAPSAEEVRTWEQQIARR